MLPYLAKIPLSEQPAFERAVRAVAANLGVKPEWLLFVMFRESGLNPGAYNKSGATGLIQFMPATARDLGTTTAYLRTLTATGQLPYVEAYYKMQMRSFRIEPRNLTDFYLLTLYPKAAGKPPGYVLFPVGTTAYRQNISINPAGGNITVAHVTSFINRIVPVAYRDSLAPLSVVAVTRPAAGLAVGGLLLAGAAGYVVWKTIHPKSTA